MSDIRNDLIDQIDELLEKLETADDRIAELEAIVERYESLCKTAIPDSSAFHDIREAASAAAKGANNE